MMARNLRKITDGLEFPEGPVWMEDGSVILTEVAAGRITRVLPDGRKQTVATPGGGPNGMAVGPDGALYLCNNGGMICFTVDGITLTGTADVTLGDVKWLKFNYDLSKKRSRY